MAKRGVFDSDPSLIAKSSELKRELQRLVCFIIDDDDYGAEAVDQAMETLCALKQLKLRKRSLSLNSGLTLCCPDEFRCPLSKDLMWDPVILASGQTFDRPFIQQWLKAGNRICPCTQQVLSHTILVPNHLVKEMISQWCMNRGIEFSKPVQYLGEEGVVTDSDRNQFLCLLEKMSSTISDKKEAVLSAAKELRLLTKRMSSIRVLFGEYEDAIRLLLSPLSEGMSREDFSSDLQEDIITTLLNLSIHDNNKKLVAETPTVIPVLIEALRTGTIETRSNAAAALFTLSAVDSNKALIGKSGALKPLIELLEEGDSLSMKDVASAIFNLCILHENKARAVGDGAVSVILKKIKNRSNVDELMAILAMLSTHPQAVEEMKDLGAVAVLLSTMRESSCSRNKENCVAILHAICFYDRTKWKEIRSKENILGTISELAQNGTPRAKRKAAGILERLNRAVNITHTA